MKREFITCLCIFVFSLVSAQNTEPLDLYKIIPLPQSIKAVQAKPFLLTKDTKITYTKGNADLKQIADFLSEYIQVAKGIKLEVTDKPVAKNAVLLQQTLKNTNKEAYQLTVNQDKITINGVAGAGVFYGAQTLRKVLLTDTNKDAVSLPAVQIDDFPRFGYRGVMLDVARHFFSVDFVKRYINLLALHNINKFHWHLSDDQGWRIEIKKYPKLTEFGSKRTETMVLQKWDQFDGTPYGGYYTQDQIKDIVKYAEKRYITIIPEIDMPGHMVAALACYPELGCTGGPYEVRKTWGVADEVLCVGNEKTFEFLEGVFTEIAALFPSTYVHVGGDECPKTAWSKCPKCQAKIKALGIVKDDKHSAEEKLQSYTISRMEKFLGTKGKKIIGWDEILEGGIAPNATIMSWRGFEGGTEAAKQNHDAIMTPGSHCYFDHYQAEDKTAEPQAIGGFTNVEKVYSLEPVPSALTDAQKKHILGAQANLWTEYITSEQQAEYMLLPRMAALSEVDWTMPEKKDFNTFSVRVKKFLPAYDTLKYNYAKHISN